MAAQVLHWRDRNKSTN